MGIRRGLLGLVAMGLASGQLAAQSVEQTSFLFRRPAATCDTCNTPASGPLTVMPADPNTQGQAPAVDNQAFAQAPAAGGEAGMSFNPAMFGDIVGSGRSSVYVPAFQVIHTTNSLGTTTTTTIFTRQVQVPVVTTGSFKISDNESPRPTDRIFTTYNYFDRVSSGPNVGLNREVMGFEKTFLGGDASFGMRLPFLQTTGGGSSSGFPDHQVGDITLITKYAFINNRETGNLVSGGLVLTVPSADHSFVPTDGVALRSVLFQPYAGWIVNSGDLFAHGFHSLVIPTDRRDITEMNNDVGVGFWAYKNGDSLVRGLVPTIEGHLYTPLNHRNNNDVIYGSNVLTLTAGVNAVFAGNSTLGVAFGVPVTGPRPDNFEAIVSFNFRF